MEAVAGMVIAVIATLFAVFVVWPAIKNWLK